jgi:sugar lactone lactonase YvrE
MPTPSSKKDRLLTASIVILSVAGILYFGIRAVMDQMQTDRKNPYEYDWGVFERSPADAAAYSQVQSIPVQAKRLTGLARGGDGFLYVAGDGNIAKFDIRGNLIETFPIGETAYCLALDAQNRIYLGMGDHVEVCDQKGSLVAQWETLGQDAIITSIAVVDSTVYLADAGQLVVWKFSSSGALLGTVGKKDRTKGVPGYVIPSPYFDVAIGADGTLWAANTGRHSLENYTHTGELKTRWGEYGTAMEEFCGCCNPSHFAILEDGGFVTSEKGIPRVKMYDRQGRFAAVVAGPSQFRAGTVGLDLVVDASGRIYVLDPTQKEVRVFAQTDATQEGAE